MSWRGAQFEIRWEEGEEPDWTAELEITETILVPLLRSVGHELRLWRVHRRAGRDGAGHRFSFYFFGSLRTAERVWEGIERSPAFRYLHAQERFRYNRFPPQNLEAGIPGICGLSDSHWNEHLQAAWTSYIMGASAAWIQLVQSIGDDLRNEQPPVPADVFYIEMHARLTSLWKHQGRHAFLHHLNAIFAYQPLLIGGREVGF